MVLADTWTPCLDVPSSAGRGGGHLLVLGTLEQRGVAGVHLEWGVAGQVWRAPAPGPGLRVEELTRVIRAVAQPGPVEARVGLVDLLRRVALHEQVHRHHTCTLNTHREGKSPSFIQRFYQYSSFQSSFTVRLQSCLHISLPDKESLKE